MATTNSITSESTNSVSNAKEGLTSSEPEKYESPLQKALKYIKDKKKLKLLSTTSSN